MGAIEFDASLTGSWHGELPQTQIHSRGPATSSLLAISTAATRSCCEVVAVQSPTTLLESRKSLPNATPCRVTDLRTALCPNPCQTQSSLSSPIRNHRNHVRCTLRRQCRRRFSSACQFLTGIHTLGTCQKTPEPHQRPPRAPRPSLQPRHRCRGEARSSMGALGKTLHIIH